MVQLKCITLAVAADLAGAQKEPGKAVKAAAETAEETDKTDSTGRQIRAAAEAAGDLEDRLLEAVSLY